MPHTGEGSKKTAVVCSREHSLELLWIMAIVPLKWNLNPNYDFLNLLLIGTEAHQRGNCDDAQPCPTLHLSFN